MTTNNTMYDMLQVAMLEVLGGIEIIRDPHESTYPIRRVGVTPPLRLQARSDG